MLDYNIYHIFNKVNIFIILSFIPMQYLHLVMVYILFM